MAKRYSKRGREILDHVDLDERYQPIQFKHQAKSLGHQVWTVVWQTTAVILLFVLVGSCVGYVVHLLASAME